MIPALIGIGLLIGGVAVVANWDKIVDWVRDFVPKLKAHWEKIRPMVPMEFQFLGDMVVEAGEKLCHIINKLYYQEDNGQWMEETTTRKVVESEVPAHIREKILAQKRQNQQADITEEIELISEG